MAKPFFRQRSPADANEANDFHWINERPGTSGSQQRNLKMESMRAALISKNTMKSWRNAFPAGRLAKLEEKQSKPSRVV